MKRISITLFLYLLIAGITSAQVPSELTSLPQEKKFVEVDKQPSYIFSVNPKYPPNAIKEGVEGTVWVGITVNEVGKVDGVRILRGARGDLDTAALNAAQGWLFTPAEKNGKPVKIEVSIPFRFKLSSSSDYVRLTEVQSPSDENKTATTAGTEIKHFTYVVSKKHQLNFTIERYIEGKLEKRFGVKGYIDGIEAGKQHLKLFIDTRNETFRVGFNDSLILGVYTPELKNYLDKNGIVLTSFATLVEKTQKPLYVYMAGKNGRGGLTQKSSILDVLAFFDYVIVVKVELVSL